MIKIKSFLTCCLICCGFSVFPAEIFKNDIFSPKIKTLRVIVNDNWLNSPIISLNSNDFVEISFDELTHEQTRYTYTIIHCDADWKKSALVPGEFMNGFQSYLIDDYETSFNTTVDYTNYRVIFPNENAEFLVSGNYAIVIAPEDDEDEPVLTACFSVVEQQVKTAMKATGNTLTGFNRSHQQLSLELTYAGSLFSSLQELKIYALQNNRRDNRILISNPLSIQPGKVVYDQNREMIFEGGNEYRKFESISTQYNGMNIQHIGYYAPYYHSVLFPDEIRNGKSYLYEDDRNGRFFIRAANTTDFDTEADYTFVHFSIPCDQPFPEDVFILSEAFNNLLDERSKMEYNFENKAYEKVTFLKQGFYNYLYVNKSGQSMKASTGLIEGNYFQTENEYSVYIYHRPLGGRYDRLIGIHILDFNNN